ncbi:MAG: cysteine-rich small domain-containing protein [Eubacteriales bacterium]|nr:cysteine-rich small domain-containing protein [Eubacteriales bacterium]
MNNKNKNSYKFFQNKDCEYFPCHNMKNEDDFNCLFCYCPLYALGKNCKGNYLYINDIKDCSNCIIPHESKNYEYILSKFNEIIELTKKHSE